MQILFLEMLHLWLILSELFLDEAIIIIHFSGIFEIEELVFEKM
jgi:hypothetical protein